MYQPTVARWMSVDPDRELEEDCRIVGGLEGATETERHTKLEMEMTQ
jgi:hypothetical protein